MARRKSTLLCDALSRMFPEAELQRLTASEGVVQRQRKVEIVALFWVLILSVGYGKQRSGPSLRTARTRHLRVDGPLGRNCTQMRGRVRSDPLRLTRLRLRKPSDLSAYEPL